jgi:signal transduction histidine kinase/DNA-binding response OmpR family regulator
VPDDAPPAAVSDPQRLNALDRTGLLDTAPEESFNRFTQLAADLLDVRAALISLVGSEEQFIKSSAGLETLGVTEGDQHLPLPRSFAQLVVTSGKPVVTADARRDDRLQDTLDVEKLGILAYAAFPLRTTEGGHILGTFCALNNAPHDWTEQELGILEGLANAIVARMELQEAKNDAERAKQAAETAQRQAEAANEAKTRFVANMSHELRTPLNSVIGYSEMFMDDPYAWDEDRLKDGLGRIKSSGEELLGLINEVLNLSKAEAGRLGLSLSTFPLEVLVEQVADEVRPRMAENDNDLEIRGTGEIGEVCTDKLKVRQILSNLLSNAAKYTEGGTVTLEVRLEDTDAEPPPDDQAGLEGEAPANEEAGEDEPCGPELARRELVIEVADTGIGVTEEEQEKIFEAFERAEGAEGASGTGLGLGIVQNLCHMLDGEVGMESEKGKGSVFTARILLEAPEDVGVERESHARSSSTTASAAAHYVPPRDDNLVLVIDDDRDARILLRNHISEAGFEVETATSGTEGLEQARELHPMAITLDVLMGQMGGWDVLAQLKDAPDLRHIPVVMISITPDEGRGVQLGATDHLVKPIDRERLVDLLEQYQRETPGEAPSFSVLVVEDDEATRDVARQVIAEEAGHDIHEAVNGRDALDALEQELDPDLVLLDLMMPKVNGFEFLRAARESLRGVPVVVLTAKDLTDEDVEHLNGQVQQIIRKEGDLREDLLREVKQRVQALREEMTSAAES